MRLYDKDVRAANVLLQSGETALQALRQELRGERRRSWGSPSRADAEIEFAGPEEGTFPESKHDEAARRLEVARCLRETITNMEETLQNLLREDSAVQTKVLSRPRPLPVAGADDGAGKGIHQHLPPELRVGLQKLRKEAVTLSSHSVLQPIPPATPKMVREADPSMAEGTVPPLRWASGCALQPWASTVVVDPKDSRQLSLGSHHELTFESPGHATAPCARPKDPVVRVVHTDRCFGRRYSDSVCNWLCW